MDDSVQFIHIYLKLSHRILILVHIAELFFQRWYCKCFVYNHMLCVSVVSCFSSFVHRWWILCAYCSDSCWMLVRFGIFTWISTSQLNWMPDMKTLLLIRCFFSSIFGAKILRSWLTSCQAPSLKLYAIFFTFRFVRILKK